MSHSDHLIKSPRNLERLTTAIDRANGKDMSTTPARATRRLNALIKENADGKPRDHGTLMTGSMVLATLADRKRMTRRVLTDRNSEGNFKASELDLATSWVDPGLGGGAYLKAYLKPEVSERLGEPPRDTVHRLYCRIQVGDRLWIREALRQGEDGIWRYDADGLSLIGPVAPAIDWMTTRKRSYCPPMHMPRWASRITLEVTGVLPERLQEISAEDCIAEGLERGEDGYSVRAVGNTFAGPQTAYAYLWDSLNADRGYGWDVNPLVWVISFKRVT